MMREFLGRFWSDILSQPVHLVLASVGTLLNILFGGWSILYTVALVMVLIDTVTGVVRALLRNEFTSSSFRKKFFPKGLTYLILFVATYHAGLLADYTLKEMPWAFPFQLVKILPSMVTLYVWIAEWHSIGENLEACGVTWWPSLRGLMTTWFNVADKFKKGG